VSSSRARICLAASNTAGPQVAVMREANVPWPNGIRAVSPVVTSMKDMSRPMPSAAIWA